MPSALVDTSAIVALLHRDERKHAIIRRLFELLRGTPITTWPVITVACHLAGPAAPLVLDWLELASVRRVDLDSGVPFMRATMRKYADRPCDLADASLLYASVATDVLDIWTLDADFTVYRRPDRKALRMLPGQ